MKKKLIMFATAALMLSACSNDSDVVVPNDVAQQAQASAVAFDTYTSSATKAGYAGIMTTATLQSEGFGVFAQYSDGTGGGDGNYSKDEDPVANFMWNQKVSYTASAWTYAPLKYWPNETYKDSETLGLGATPISSHIDKLSFFAYAPYVAQVTDTYTGQIVGPTYGGDPAIDNSNITANGGGIEAVIANDATNNDPWVRYTVASKPSESVDLLWGVAPSGGLSYTNVSGGTTTILEGMPLVNLIKPSKDQKIKFLFQHALARLGLTVVAAVDQIAAGGSLDGQTEIAVESVNITEVTATKQLKTSGALNLKNTTAFQSLWSNKDGDINFTVSNVSGGELNPKIAYDTDAATTWTAFNAEATKGVDNVEKPVIADSKYFMVIPNHANTTLQVVITYYVITKDAKLNGSYSEVKNVITKNVTIPTLTNNKAYNLKLILGLTSVKLDAEVADWEVDGSNEVNLPHMSRSLVLREITSSS